MRSLITAVTLLLAATAVPRAAACAAAITLIEQAEGLRLCTYVDTTGHKTICYGFNLDASGAEQKIDDVGGNWDSVYYHGGCLSQSQCTDLLQSEVDTASSEAASIFGVQCACIQAVLIDMTYNLGAGGMSSFNTFIAEIKAHEWASAASDIRGTLWCRQVGNRCTRDSEIISQGCQAEEALAAGPSSRLAPLLVGLGVALVALVAIVALFAVRRTRTRTLEVLPLVDQTTINYGAAL